MKECSPRNLYFFPLRCRITAHLSWNKITLLTMSYNFKGIIKAYTAFSVAYIQQTILIQGSLEAKLPTIWRDEKA